MNAARCALYCAVLFVSATLVPAVAADSRRATLPPTYTLDLESGRVGGMGATVDLFWQAKTRIERCLGPMFNSRALIAPLPAAEFNQSDLASLMGLAYEHRCFSHTNSGGELRRGTTFAVRTVEGNFAKVRVRDISPDNVIALEWQLFIKASVSPGTHKPTGNPALDIQALFEQARTALRAKKPADAVPALQQAVELARKLPAGNPRRIDALSQAGNLLWSARRLDLAENALLAAARDIEAAPKAAAPEAVQSIYRMLGIVHRDGRKYGEAAKWLERSIKLAENLPDSTPGDRDAKYWHISSDSAELASAHCGAGNTAAAEAAERQRLEACKRIARPEHYGSCKTGTRICERGWMR